MWYVLCNNVSRIFSSALKMAEETGCKNCPTGAAWAGLIIAVIALIMIIIVYAFYFAERNEFLKEIDVVWNVEVVSSSTKTVGGESFTLYTVGSDITSGDTLTVTSPTGGAKAGEWFAITNTNDKSVNVTSGTGVNFSSFPTTSSASTAAATTSVLPGKGSWIMAWASPSSLINLVPGQGVKQVP